MNKAKPKRGKKKKEDLEELKKEIEIDEHKIAVDELVQRLGTHLERVCLFSFTM